ncbi:MAG: NAD(P)/FAD-dependent oxidoreductase [Bdellovibrio sp.]
MLKPSYKVLILGGGAGGISVAAKLSRTLKDDSIAVVEPSEKHYYQPLFTVAGGGLMSKEETVKSEASVMPPGVVWIKEQVLSIDPIAKTVAMSHGITVGYEYLVVATGLKLNWDKIEGLEGNLGKNGIITVYQYDQVDKAAEEIKKFQGGTALFVMPPPPIKCAGAPQKIMYIAENIFRSKGISNKTKIQFATAGKAMFGVPVFAKALDEIVKEKNIEPKFAHKIVGVDAAKKEAMFEVTGTDGKVTRQNLKYDLLHIVPTMSAHSFISESSLAFQEGEQKGWLAVDKHTLQHIKYPNIFGVGDVTGVPNSKTGAAVRKQYPVVVKNLLAVLDGKNPEAKYDGYSSCPLITDIGKVMLAEFGYDGKLMPTFPLNPAVPRKSMWILKKDILPKLYWYGMLKGIA